MTTLTEADRKLAAGFAGPLETAHGITRIGMCKVSGRHLSLAPNTKPDAADLMVLKAKWMAVGAAFQEGAEECNGCGYCSETSQRQPYGEGWAMENLSECTLGAKLTDKPDACPALQRVSEEQEQA